MPTITTEDGARHHARHHADAKTLVVSEHGDIHVDGNVDDVCANYDTEKKKYFVLKGEKKQKKKTTAE